MPGTNEVFSRVKIDVQLRDQAWGALDINLAPFEYAPPAKTEPDYLLRDCNGRLLALIEAKKASITPAEPEVQAKSYVQQLKAPYTFLTNGEEIRFWEWLREAFPRSVKTFFSQDDFERLAATALVKLNPLPAIALPIAEEDQFRERIASIEAVIDQQNTATVRSERLLASVLTGNLACTQAASMEAVA